MDYRHETGRAILEAESHLLAAHTDLMHSAATDVEGLDRAACPTHISNLARLALGASYDGVTADQWREWAREALEGHDAAAVLLAAEHCMRANGLWPWHR